MAGLFDDVLGSTPRRGGGLFDDVLNDDEKDKKPAGFFSELGSAVSEGAQKTYRSARAALSTYLDNSEDVVEQSARTQEVEAGSRATSLTQLKKDVQERKVADDDSLWSGIKNVASAIIDNPRGGAQLVAEQAPNAAVALGTGFAGAKGGALIGSAFGPAGAAVGGTVGFIAGLFGANTLLETGGKAVEAAQDKDFTPEERQRVIREGATKGAVITAVDTATLGASKYVLGAANRAVEQATIRTLSDAGIDAQKAARSIQQAQRDALQASQGMSRDALQESIEKATVEAMAREGLLKPDLVSAVQSAQKAAFDTSTTLARRTGRGATALGLETAGESFGEYTGELAATGEASFTDAALEAVGGLATSVPELFVAKRLDQPGILTQEMSRRRDLDIPAPPPALGATQELEQATNDLKAAVDPYLGIRNAPDVDTAIANLDTATTVDLTPPPVMNLAQRQAMIDRNSELLTQAENAGMDFDRRDALGQAAAALPPAAPRRADSFVDLTPMDPLQARQRLVVLGEETGQPLNLQIVPHPSQAGKMAIARRELPLQAADLDLPARSVTTDEANARLDLAAQQRQRDARNEMLAPYEAVTDQLQRGIEGAEGTATRPAATILDGAQVGVPANQTGGPGMRAYDRVEGAAPSPIDVPATPALRNADERRVASLQAENDASLQALAERRAANAAQADAATTAQIEATNQRPAAPPINSVIQALATPAIQRTAEQQVVIKQAEARLEPTDFSIAQRAATAPFRLSQEERMRLRDMRSGGAPQTAALLSPTADAAASNLPRPSKVGGVPASQLTDEQLSATAGNMDLPAVTRRGAQVELLARQQEARAAEPPAVDTAAVDTQLAAAAQTAAAPAVDTAQQRLESAAAVGRLAQPTGGRIILSGAKMSTKRAAPGATISVNDGDTAHQARVVDPGKLGAPGRLLTQVARVFGKKIVVFESDTMQSDGFVLDDDNESIYLNAKSSVSPLAVFGHEMTHLLKRDNAAAYNALESVVKRVTTQEGSAAFAQDYGQGANLEELTSDLVGNRFREESFWNDVFNEIAAQNPENARSIVTRLAASLTKAVNAFLKVVRQQGFKADQYVTDLEAVKGAVKTAFTTYAKQQRMTAMQAEAEMMREESQVDLAAGSKPFTYTPQLQGNKREMGVPLIGTGERVMASRTRYDRGAYEGTDDEGTTEPGRDQGVPADAAQDGRGAGEDGGGEVPSYGRAREGAVSVVGRHYSPEPRQALSGAFYGRGLKGAERDRLNGTRDPRLLQRVYFYVDNGKGIRPEAGVGGYAHEVRLDNIYDPATRLVPPQPDSNSFESAVINAGFDGYLVRDFTATQGAVVLLGPRHSAVPVKPMGQVAAAAAPAAAQPTTLRKGLLSREAEAVNVDAIPGARVRMGNLEIPADSRDAANAELERIGSNARFSNAREYKLDLEREERQKGKAATVSTEEQAAVLRDAQANKVSEKEVRELLKQARDIKKQYPSSAGWAPLKLAGLDVKTDEESGKQTIELKWQPVAYAYNRPPGASRAPAKLDEAWAGKVADSFYRLIKDIYGRAQAGDKNAQIIVGHQTWYRNVAEVLRREYGAQGDLLADLLGATSPNTPVDTNWRFSVDILRRFMKGDFNNELAKFDEYVKAGGVVSKYPAADKIKQVSGKLYGMNSSNAMKALLDMWRVIEPGSAPKARNFALNLIGQSNMATIDVWAARMLRRAADAVRGADLPRIPPPAEQGVSGTWNAQADRVTGEFGFGARVMDLVSEKLAAEGVTVTPPDLQAIAWFAEKELWGKNRWTTVTGEGGSFEENIEAFPVERYLAGWSIQQGERVPRSDKVSLAQARVMSMLAGDNSVVTARVMPTKGLYGGTVEESFDTEWTVEKGKHDPSLVMAEIAKLAAENEQYDIFVSRVIGPNEYSENARPGVEIYFRSKRALDAAMPVLERFTSKGQDGFTMAVDPRAKAAGEFIGVRLQYVPEISIRWDSGLRSRLLKEGELEKELKAKTALLDEIAAEVSTMEGVAFARAQQYDTVVVGKENYDEYIDRGAAGKDQGARSESWFGQPVRQAVERAAARLPRDEGSVDEGRVPDVGSAEADGEVTTPEAPAEEPPAATLSRQRKADEVPRDELAGRKLRIPVLVEETGQTATITMDAKAALDDVDEREAAMRRLLECLRK